MTKDPNRDTGERTCTGFTEKLLEPSPAMLRRLADQAKEPPPERRQRRRPRDR